MQAGMRTAEVGTAMTSAHGAGWVHDVAMHLQQNAVAGSMQSERA